MNLNSPRRRRRSGLVVPKTHSVIYRAESGCDTEFCLWQEGVSVRGLRATALLVLLPFSLKSVTRDLNLITGLSSRIPDANSVSMVEGLLSDWHV